MQASNFDESNTILSPPEGMSEDECRSIYAARIRYAGTFTSVVTCWRPTVEEMEALKAGKPLWLIVLGSMMPPVILTTDRPFTT